MSSCAYGVFFYYDFEIVFDAFTRFEGFCGFVLRFVYTCENGLDGGAGKGGVDRGG